MLATIGSYLDPWEAHVLRARLEADGIPATVAGDHHMIMNWPISIALGGARLQVPSQFLDQAREILAACNAGDFEKDLMASYPGTVDTCPKCGSEKIKRSESNWRRILVILTTVVASAPFPAKGTRMCCLECDHRWKEKD